MSQPVVTIPGDVGAYSAHDSQTFWALAKNFHETVNLKGFLEISRPVLDDFVQGCASK
jgi:hypothetical protein